jgi:hypothetical protein
MSTFTHMAAVLTTTTSPAWSMAALPPKGLSRTERIRRLLKAASRPVNAEEIAWDMDVEFPDFGVHLVWLLLKYDIQKGRVILDAGRYSWNHAYDTAEAQAIRAAVKLLRAHGYTVKEPKA